MAPLLGTRSLFLFFLLSSLRTFKLFGSVLCACIAWRHTNTLAYITYVYWKQLHTFTQREQIAGFVRWCLCECVLTWKSAVIMITTPHKLEKGSIIYCFTLLLFPSLSPISRIFCFVSALMFFSIHLTMYELFSVLFCASQFFAGFLNTWYSQFRQLLFQQFQCFHAISCLFERVSFAFHAFWRSIWCIQCLFFCMHITNAFDVYFFEYFKHFSEVFMYGICLYV